MAKMRMAKGDDPSQLAGERGGELVTGYKGLKGKAAARMAKAEGNTLAKGRPYGGIGYRTPKGKKATKKPLRRKK